MTGSQVIVLATPVFLLLIAAELAWGLARGTNVYRLNDAISSISLGVLSQLVGLFTKLLAIGIYTAVYHSVALFPEHALWSTWYGILLALVFYDFCYYWLHRTGHEVALFWAAHVVHHQSEAYNLSTALRQTSSGNLLGWIFYLPMAIAGVPPLLFAIVALVDLLYQFWVHTELVGKLGWFDRVFCSPSNHRVHHAINDAYLDKNYGGILIVWDRMFGSFREEREKCIYGTRSALGSLVGQRRGLLVAVESVLEHPGLGQQDSRMVHAARLAPRECRADRAETGIRHPAGRNIQSAAGPGQRMVCLSAIPAAAGGGPACAVVCG